MEQVKPGWCCQKCYLLHHKNGLLQWNSFPPGQTDFLFHAKIMARKKTNKQTQVLLYENSTQKYNCPHSYPRRAAMRTGSPQQPHRPWEWGCKYQENRVVIHILSFIWKDKGAARTLLAFTSWKVPRTCQEPYKWQLQPKRSNGSVLIQVVTIMAGRNLAFWEVLCCQIWRGGQTGRVANIGVSKPHRSVTPGFLASHCSLLSPEDVLSGGKSGKFTPELGLQMETS